MFETKVVEKLEIHSVSNFSLFFFKFVFYEITWKNCRAGQVTDDNMAQTHCILDT